MKPKARAKPTRPPSFAAGVGRALRRAAKDAQKTARMYGTPIYVWENGKVVAKKPWDFLDKHRLFKHRRCNAPVTDAISSTEKFRFDLTRTDLGAMAWRRSAGT